MKWLSVILSFCIILLTLAPKVLVKDTLMDFNCSENSCCSSAQQDQDPKEKNDDGCDEHCSLCTTCCHYFAALSHSQHSVASPFVYINHDFYNSSEVNYSNVFFEVWNPPKQA